MDNLNPGCKDTWLHVCMEMHDLMALVYPNATLPTKDVCIWGVIRGNFDHKCRPIGGHVGPSPGFLQENNGFVLVRWLDSAGISIKFAHKSQPIGREPCVPSVVFLQENHGLVLVKGPNSGGS